MIKDCTFNTCSMHNYLNLSFQVCGYVVAQSKRKSLGLTIQHGPKDAGAITTNTHTHTHTHTHTPTTPLTHHSF